MEITDYDIMYCALGASYRSGNLIKNKEKIFVSVNGY